MNNDLPFGFNTNINPTPMPYFPNQFNTNVNTYENRLMNLENKVNYLEKRIDNIEYLLNQKNQTNYNPYNQSNMHMM